MLFQNFLYLDLTVYILYVGVHGLLISFLMIQLKKMDKIARPFVLSVVFYFLCISLGGIFMYIYNRGTVWDSNVNIPEYDMLVFINQLGLVFLVIAPLFLIYNLEKKFFQNTLLSDKHIITIIQIALISLFFLGWIFVYTGYPSGNLVSLYLLIMLFQVVFFSGGFLYIGIKSTGYIKKLAYIVAIGYLALIFVNLFIFGIGARFRTGNYDQGIDVFFNVMVFLFILRTVCTLIMTYGLIKLYNKKD